MSTTAVHPEEILRSLVGLWGDLAQDQAEAGGVLRACTMTLIVAAQDAADAEAARETVGKLMRDHPSRAIILHRGGSGGLDARVFAECWKPFGSAQQICAEGIEVAAGSSDYAEAARFVLPLRAPDVPTVLWCRSVDALDGGGYHALFPLAAKLIFDSRGAPDAGAAVRALRRLHAYGYRVADLHWARLTGWREVVSHLFDNGSLRAKDVIAARVGYGGPAAATCAHYFEAWMRTSLPEADVSVEREDGPVGIRSLSLATHRGDLTMVRGQQAVEVSGLGLSYASALPPATEDALMREELAILGPDAVYERVLVQ